MVSVVWPGLAMVSLQCSWGCIASTVACGLVSWCLVGFMQGSPGFWKGGCVGCG